MYKTTTPTYTFNLPFETSTIAKFLLTFKQRDKVINKTDNEMVKGERSITVTLSESETASLRPEQLFVQLKVITVGAKVMASNIIPLSVQDVLNNSLFGGISDEPDISE